MLMPCRAGITTRMRDRKAEWQQRYPAMQNWQTFGPFANRSEAQDWEDRQIGCERHGGGDEPDTAAPWYGYRFDF